jgi:hypothetical protein
MTAVVKVDGRETAKPPSFQGIERLMDALDAARYASSMAREASPELISQLDAAIVAAAANQEVLKKAAAPGKIVSVGTYLALLLDAYPNSGQNNSENFGGFLVDDVMELAPPIAAVEIACRRWRQRSKFRPAISELLDEVKQAKGRIESAQAFVAQLPSLRARAVKDLEQYS